MNTFKCKLPKAKYFVKIKTGKGLRKFLESYGCYLDKDYDETSSSKAGYITVWVGCYDYTLGHHGDTSTGEEISTKEFKRLVIETVGEA